jgi:LysM repeat protein
VLLRYVAPAAFLIAVTGVALGIRGGLRSDVSPSAGPAVVARADASPTSVRRKPAPAKRWYVIQSGDTFDAIATRFGTSVASLLRLNPGVEPTALRPGEQVRIR